MNGKSKEEYEEKTVKTGDIEVETKNEEFEKKRAEACTALTNMASICIHERLTLKDNIDLEHTKKILNSYFEILLEKIDALQRRQK